MAIVSAPSALMTQTAAQLLAAAAELGLPADVVATTGDTPLGLGFEVPDELFDHWVKASAVSVDETPVPAPTAAPDVPATPEPHGTESPEPKVPRRRGPGKPVTDGPEV